MNVIAIRSKLKPQNRLFDPIQFISTVGGLLIDIGVNESIGEHERADALYGDLYSLLAKTATEVVSDRSWDYARFLTHYPDLKSVFEDAEREYGEQFGNPGSELITVYCPFDCMKMDLKKSEPARNCTFCGEEMSAEYESFLNDFVLSAF